MDLKELRSLYRFLKKTDIVEFEVEEEGRKVRLRRGGAAEVHPAAPAPAAPGPSAEEPAKEVASNVKVITSPMVGTFYRAPSPEAPPFVELGSQVKSGQVVCIIEAMKLMNEVESESAGKVVAVLVENGQPVEYGEPLMHIEP